MATSASPLVSSSSVTPSYKSTHVFSPKEPKFVVNRMPSSHSLTALESTIEGDANDSDSMSSGGGEHKTTEWQTFIHLVKGYIGPGCLSLPWAVSQLGLYLGCLFLGIMALWTSYNCWTVVKLKRFIERQQQQQQQSDEVASEAPSTVTNATSVTYPGVGEWAYGRSFQTYVSIAVCTQQLAICTVFLSFIGENLQAVLQQFVHSRLLSSHVMVITLALPFVMSLSFLPDLKKLAPVMSAGTALLLASFVTLGVVVGLEWSHRPAQPTFNLTQSPLAACAILYSYEGICLILPIETAMKRPQEFKRIFTLAMVTNFLALAAVASLCVLAFGQVTNGSVTAYLIETRSHDKSIIWWLMAANTLVSLSVLLTYPLQLFPSLELVAPWAARTLPGGEVDEEDELDNELLEFEPLPSLPEHDTIAVEYNGPPQEHRYGLVENNDDEARDPPTSEGDQASRKATRSVVAKALSSMTVPGDTILLRAGLVMTTYIIAVAIPNVQALISLAGALAGSSTALLVPPILELAWINHLERDASDGSRTGVESASYCCHQRIAAQISSKLGPWWVDKIKAYMLVLLGVLFAVIGTASSISDIIRVYRGE